MILVAGFIATFFLIKEDRQRTLLNNRLIEVSNIMDGQFFSKVKGASGSMALNGEIVKLCANSGPVDSPRAVIVQNEIKELLGASIVYVMDGNGTVISSTKFAGGKGTLTGQNYKFRPYFTKAIAGAENIYGAVGVTTLERGVYFSAPVKDRHNGVIIGVAVVKMGLEAIDEVLGRIPDMTAIVSPEGVVFSSNNKDWILKSVYPVDERLQDELEKNKQFAGMRLSVIKSSGYFTREHEELNGKYYRVASYPFYLYGWKIIMIQDLSRNAPLSTLQRGVMVSIGSSVIAVLYIIFLAYTNRYTSIAMKQFKSNYLEIYESVNDAIFIHDASDGSVLDVNKRTCEMFGYPKEDFLSQKNNISSSGDGGLDPRQALAYILAAASGTPQLFEWKAMNRSGETFWVEVNLKKAVITGRKVVLAVVRDINKRKIDEQKMKELVGELQRSNAELQEFAYVASHDLKEPLRMVSSYVQLLAKRYTGKLDKDADEFIAFASGGAKQMQQLIEDLLMYSRVSSKSREPVAVDVNIIIERLVMNLKFLLEEKKGTVRYSGLPVIKADVTQAEQLFMNLISNSLKFADKTRPPVIEITSEREGDMWKFAVKDNGIGIENNYFDKIFVIFQKLHSKEEYEGTGIGLSICKKIVELHGGRIWVESVIGKGTSVFFTLPGA